MQDEQRVMTAAIEVIQDWDRAIDWYRNTPIPEFNDQTAEQLVAHHKTEAVLTYLRSISAGASG